MDIGSQIGCVIGGICIVGVYEWHLRKAKKQINELKVKLDLSDATTNALRNACLERVIQQEQDAEEVDDHLTIKLAECADELIGVIDSLHGGKRIAKKLRKKYETRIVLKVKDQNPDEPLKQDEMELDEWGGM